jgi:hypothetical protein
VTHLATLAFWWQEYRGAIIALVLVGWLSIATVTVFFLGLTPAEPPCTLTGGPGSQPMDPRATEASCALFRAETGAEWAASLTLLQRLTQEPQVWIIWYVIPILVFGAAILLFDRLAAPRPRPTDAPAT